MIYLDNSATTNHKPFSVKWAAFSAAMKNWCANPSRSGHLLSNKVAEKVMSARISLCEAFNAPSPLNVVFTSGCTESLNTVIFGTAKKNGHIITSIYEHNSTLRAIEKLKSTHDITVTYLEKIDMKSLVNARKSNTYLIALNHISNVTGHEIDIDLVGRYAKKHDILFLLDGAQSAGHKEIDMKKSNINFLALAGHKGLHGMMGVGALLINSEIFPLPMKHGGTGTNSEDLKMPSFPPESLEAGTTNVSGILSLNAGLKFTMKNFSKIKENEQTLSLFLIQELKKIKNIVVYTKDYDLNGIISFNIKEVDSPVVANYLSEKYAIYTRSGLHCAPLIHKHLGSEKSGMVRVSLGYKTKKRHLAKLLNALKSFSLD